MSTRSDSGDTKSPPWDPKRPYQELPRLPPPTRLETRPVLKACVAARASLASLATACELIPNPAILLTCLPLLEAQASSEIENIVTTADSLFRHLDAPAGADPATREALRYREALFEGQRLLAERPLGLRVAERVCSRIKAVDMSVRSTPGTAIAEAGTGRVVYTPPEGRELILELCADWERFVHAGDELDPLVRMAVAHYQFEAIHPFSDGNGRTGRILNCLFLVEQGLLAAPILYLSRSIIARKHDYYRLLLGVTSAAAWEEWILYVLEAVAEISRWTLDRIAAIRELVSETRTFVRAKLPKLYSAELVDLCLARPCCRISNLVQAGIAQRQAAARYLKELVRVGVLVEEKHGREKLFVNTRLLSLLATEDASYAGFA